MAFILVLLSHPGAAGALRRAVQMDRVEGVAHTVHAVPGWRELAERAARAGPALAFVDPYHGGAFAAAELRRLRALAPGLELVAYADFAARPATDAFALAGLGVRAVICAGGDDDAALLRQALARHPHASPCDAMLARLAERLPPRLRASLEPVLCGGEAPPTAAALAMAARCSPRTLRRALRAAGLPPADELLAWHRVLHAARLLADPHRTADGVARTLGYSSGSALRRSLKRLAGVRPEELRRHGFGWMSERFLARCGVLPEPAEGVAPYAEAGGGGTRPLAAAG
jgi:AraC-like DNA-binding protein